MSTKNIELFYDEIKQNEVLQEKVSKVILEEQDKLRESITQLAEGLGYRFSKEDVKQVTDEALRTKYANGELDDSTLEAVTGGSVVGTVIFFAGVGLVTAVIGTGVAATVIGEHVDW